MASSGPRYVRVKRQKTTYFLDVEPSLTVLEVKQKLQEHCEQAPECQQLMKKRNIGWVALEDAKRLEELDIEDESVIALCYVQEDGNFEDVDITPYNRDVESNNAA
ncbi:unnamed protein product [Ostreobium quekettii]|uniref:Ubiquitin-like domain-containing protein n=1 Tax=Ostreobium quekettii TaxID=121088 RepID=A0A8S1JDP7_9CHLO|nr:unnamed protein product [Ostreobium quekettii]|eukprot:evm.model.scf_902.3 EVM.evm.TU.scf_902.3   scf_902:33492-36674(+)